jgi:type VI secretion system VgrG family protein
LADEGIFYFIETDDGGTDVVVFGDDTGVYQPIADPSTVQFDDSGRIGREVETVETMGWQRRVVPGKLEVVGFDYRRPTTRLAERDAEEEGKGRELEVYAHDLDWNGFTISQPSAKVRLGQQRRTHRVGAGKSRVRRLKPGSWFELEGHPHDELNTRLVVVEIAHKYFARDSSRASGANVELQYLNHVTCVKSDVVAHPERPKRVHRQITETATVVGPAGEEIHTDEHGRVKVQFHWDREGKGDDHSSCWIRTMVPWAGSAWGMQFVPRVGMEVVVSFAGGDTDRPVILGALYNGANVPPFALPAHKTQSGLRSRTTPGGDGANELRFDDAAGAEQIYLHAQRDLVEAVENDRVRTVRGHQNVRIDKSSRLEVLEDHTMQVAGNQVTVIEKNMVLHVVGRQIINVDGSGGSAGETPPEIDGAQEAPGEAPTPPQDAATGEAALEGFLRASSDVLGAVTRWVTEAVPPEHYDTAMLMQRMAVSCLETAITLYLESRTLANDPPPDVAPRAANGTLRVVALREMVASEIDQALKPQPSEMQRVQTATVDQLREADRLAQAADRIYGQAARGEPAEPMTEVTGTMRGGGGAEDQFSKVGSREGGMFGHVKRALEEAGQIDKASEMTIKGGGTIYSDDGFKIVCGGNTIELTPGGIEINGVAVKIKGATIHIESPLVDVKGNAVNVTGGSIVNIKAPTVDVKGTPIQLNC